MAVLIEAITVVVRRSTLEREYPGGVGGYMTDCPNDTFRADDDLAAVGFMTPSDVEPFVERLVDAGLSFLDDGGFADVAVVDERAGPTTRCDWLEFHRTVRMYAMCWLVGSEPGRLAIPVGRDPRLLGEMTFVPLEEVDARLEQLGTDGSGLSTYRDLVSGDEVLIGRRYDYMDPMPQEEAREQELSFAQGSSPHRRRTPLASAAASSFRRRANCSDEIADLAAAALHPFDAVATPPKRTTRQLVNHFARRFARESNKITSPVELELAARTALTKYRDCAVECVDEYFAHRFAVMVPDAPAPEGPTLAERQRARAEAESLIRQYGFRNARSAAYGAALASKDPHARLVRGSLGQIREETAPRRFLAWALVSAGVALGVAAWIFLT